jgi:hypothetical protein
MVICPNYNTCKLVNTDGFLESEEVRGNYIRKYCEGNSQPWEKCNRFMTHETLHFCPDFVFPDSEMTVNEVMDQFDNGMN